jgi:hypothetical protein
VSWKDSPPIRFNVYIRSACDAKAHSQPQDPNRECVIASPSDEHEQFANVQNNFVNDSSQVHPQSGTPAAVIACPVIEHEQSSAAQLL